MPKKPVTAKPAAKPQYKSPPRSTAPKKKPGHGSEKTQAITERTLRFIDEYVASNNGAQSAVNAGYSTKGANVTASRLLSNPIVMKIVSDKRKAIHAKLEIKQEDLMRGLLREVQADPHELVQYRRPACRHCYGNDFKYQFTPAEMEEARDAHDMMLAERRAMGITVPAKQAKFDEKGGLGFDKRKAPHPDCPECFGEGRGEIFALDTRHMSEDARAIYAGVHQGKDGLKILTQDRNAARNTLFKAMGWLKDNVKLSGDPQDPLVMLLQQISGSSLKPVALPDEPAAPAAQAEEVSRETLPKGMLKAGKVPDLSARDQTNPKKPTPKWRNSKKDSA